jgi:DNA-binding transcriptional LysR family regulator
MELRHLRYFVAVAREGSFLRAASRLRVAQPALSKQIRDLEREVGVKLLERLPRGTRLTAAGDVFLTDARAALEHAERAGVNARQADERRGSSLHLAQGELVVWAPVVADLVAAFRAAHPAVELRVSNLDEAEMYAALQERRVDGAALFVTSWPVKGFDGHRLVSFEAGGVLLPASHPLAAKRAVHLSELRDLTFLHLAGQHWPLVYRAIHHALRERGLVPARVQPVSMESANVHLATGDTWALAGETSAAPYRASRTIVYRPFLERAIPGWLALLWPRDAASPLVSKLLEVARRLPPITSPARRVEAPNG